MVRKRRHNSPLGWYQSQVNLIKFSVKYVLSSPLVLRTNDLERTVKTEERVRVDSKVQKEKVTHYWNKLGDVSGLVL